MPRKRRDTSHALYVRYAGTEKKERYLVSSYADCRAVASSLVQHGEIDFWSIWNERTNVKLESWETK